MLEDHQFDVITLARDGQYDRIKCAVQGGADVNATNAFDETALMCACFYGHHDCVKSLLNLGANVNVRDCDGVTPLMWAAREGRTDSVEMLLESGANVDDKCINGVTALMRACRHGYVDCVKVLLEKGANVNEKKDQNVTALIIAVFNGHSDCAEILLQNGANVNDKDIFDCTALMFASDNEDLVCVKLLQQYDAKVNGHEAEFRGNIEGVNVPLRNGANVAENSDRENVLDSTHPNIQKLPEGNGGVKSYSNCKKCRCNACKEERRYVRDSIEKQNEDIRNLKRKTSGMGTESTSACTSIPSDMIHIDYLPPEKRRLFDQIDDKSDDLVCSLQPRPVIEHLWSKGILTEEQYQEVKSFLYPTDISKSKYLLRLVKFGPKYLEALRESLTKTNQKHLLACLTLGSD